MKKIKVEWLLLAISLFFLALTGGIAIGQRMTGGELRITTANASVAQSSELTGGNRPTAAPPSDEPAAPTEAALPSETATPSETTTPSETAASPASGARIDLNSAAKETLMTLPGIGEVLAQRIVDYRAAHGAFRSVSELMQIEGIGEKRYNAILEFITVEEAP